MSEFLRETLKNRYGGLPSAPKRPDKNNGAGGGIRRRRDYSPLSWEEYFESSQDVCVSDKNIFRVYQAGTDGPLLLLLHGGGHSALSWAVFTKSIIGICNCQVLAIDLRGHGETTTEDDSDLSADTLAKDVGEVINKMYETVSSPPPILMVGHSMGGAIAVHVGVQRLLLTLIGLVVIDVVEGTALEALSLMQAFLKSRPSSFRSLEEGIEWSVRSGQTHNVESARVSMVGQLVRRCDDNGGNETKRGSFTPPPSHFCNAISEETEEEKVETTEAAAITTTTTTDCAQQQEVKQKFTWRIDLSKTDRFWEGWFRDMSKLFLSCPVPKLLILAGVDRLDRELTIGQMQGKFQMQVLPRCGHCVHEDAPDKVAEVLVSFLVRLRFAVAKESFQRPMPAC